jgi:predicted MFS family arabinose efflux permease
MRLWSAQVVSTFGSSASSVIYPLLILALTNSPSAAGIASALRILPYLVFSIPVGALIDRWDRRRVMIVCDVGRLVAVSCIPLAIWFDALSLWLIYLVSTVEGTFFVFFNIAEVAALPRVVPKEQLPAATAQNHAAFSAAIVAGPSVGTLLYEAIGRAAPFVFDAITYLISALSVWAIRTPFRAGVAVPVGNLKQQIGEGMRWLWDRPVIRTTAFLTGGVNFVYAATPLIMIVLAKEMNATDFDIGVMFSVGGLGGIFGSFMGARIQRAFTFGQVVTTIIWLQAILFPLYFFAPNVLLLGVVFSAIYLLAPIYNVVQFSYRVALIPDALQGRVNSVFRLIGTGLQPLGAALCGVLLEYAGAGWTIAVFGLCYFALAIWSSCSRAVRDAPAFGAATAG